jgi:hypothetical protein
MKGKNTVLVCTVMSCSPPQSLENLGFGVISASCGHTASELELQIQPKCSFVTDENEEGK